MATMPDRESIRMSHADQTRELRRIKLIEIEKLKDGEFSKVCTKISKGIRDNCEKNAYFFPIRKIVFPENVVRVSNHFQSMSMGYTVCRQYELYSDPESDDAPENMDGFQFNW